MGHFVALVYDNFLGKRGKTEYIYPLIAKDLDQAKKIAKYFCELNMLSLGEVLPKGVFNFECIRNNSELVIE